MALVRTLLLLVIAASLIVADPAQAARKKKKKLAPGDLQYSRTETVKEFAPVIFPHWRHVPQYRCYVCHSALFEMQQSEGLGERMHKPDMCGACHDGEPAFAIGMATCHRCHVSDTENSDDGKKKKSAKKKKKKKTEAEGKTD